MHEQQQSVFFKLPPELRNRIYEMAFESRDGPVDLVAFFPPNATFIIDQNARLPDLDAVAPPSSAVLQSCQQICLESKGIFETALESYRTKEFIADIRGRKLDAADINSIPDGLLGQVGGFTFLVKRRSTSAKVSCSWSEQGWHVKVTEECPSPATLTGYFASRLALEYTRLCMFDPSLFMSKDSNFLTRPFNKRKLFALLVGLDSE